MKVVIVGGGVIGLSCAAALVSRAGIDVTLVERGNPGAGSTTLAIGMAVRFQLDPASHDLMSRSYDLMDSLTKKHGLVLRTVGHLAPGRTPRDIASFEMMRSRQLELGLPASEILVRRQVEELFPDYRPPADVTSASWDPHACYLDGAELVGILTSIVRNGGGRVLRHTEVLGLDGPGGGGAVTVRTSEGTIPADVVVNAAGAWSGIVGERLGAPVPVYNERHEAYIFTTSPRRGPLPMMLDYIPGASRGEGLYFRVEGEDRLVAGLHASNPLHEAETNIDNFSNKLTETDIELVFGQLTEVLPDLDLGFSGGWAGLYPHHPANRYVLGPHPDNPAVVLGVGLGGRGLGPGMALGEVVADWVTDGRPIHVPAAAGLLPTIDDVQEGDR